MEIYNKLLIARNSIKNTKVAKQGENTYTGFKYFLPSQISDLVHDACIETGLVTMYNLVKESGEYIAQLQIFNIDKTEESIVFVIPTAMPEIKATNEAQRFGGMATYSERYLKMIAFDITDNSLDYDTNENTKKQIKTPETLALPKITPKFYDVWDKEILDGGFVELKGKKYKMSKEQIQECTIYLQQLEELYQAEQQKQQNNPSHER